VNPDAVIPEHARRTLEQVLTPGELCNLELVCGHVAGLVESTDRLPYLLSASRDDEAWCPIVAAAMATDPDRVEAMLIGGLPIPGSIARLRERTGVHTFAESETLEADRRAKSATAARAAARRMAREGAAEAKPRYGWMTRCGALPVSVVATALGLAVTRRGLSPCPACTEERRGSKDRRPAVSLRPDDAGWHCWRCQASGDAVHLAAHHILSQRRPETAEDRDTLGRWFAVQGWA